MQSSLQHYTYSPLASADANPTRKYAKKKEFSTVTWITFIYMTCGTTCKWNAVPALIPCEGNSRAMDRFRCSAQLVMSTPTHPQPWLSHVRWCRERQRILQTHYTHQALTLSRTEESLPSRPCARYTTVYYRARTDRSTCTLGSASNTFHTSYSFGGSYPFFRKVNEECTVYVSLYASSQTTQRMWFWWWNRSHTYTPCFTREARIEPSTSVCWCNDVRHATARVRRCGS